MPARSHRPRFIERRILLGVLNVVDHPVRTLIVGGVILAACVGSALWKLHVSSDENKLFSSDDPNFRAYLEFDNKFPENEAVYVIVEPTQPDQSPKVERWTGIADAIAGHVRKLTNYVESVDAKVPLRQLGSQGLLFEQPQALAEDVRQAGDFAQLAQLWGQEKLPLIGGVNLPGAISQNLLGRTRFERFLAGVRLSPLNEQTVSFVGLLAEHWNTTLNDRSSPIEIGTDVPNLMLIGAQTPEDLGYYYVPDETDRSRHLLMVRVYPKANYDSLTSITDAVAGIRSAVREAASQFPEFKVGVTGRPALDADEMETTDRDSNRAEILAMIAVFIGLVVMLRSIWLALAAEICLAVGIGWTFGWATVSVGELNLLSIVFLIALIGIGMDYLVQVLTRYRSESRRHIRPRAVWARVFRHAAAPINTACLGAAGAFLVSLFTKFRGAAELGLIAGGGLLLCLLSGYTVLPALLTIFPSRAAAKVPRSTRAPSQGIIRLALPAIWIIGLAMALRFIPNARFNPNLLDLQAPNLESTKLVRKLQTWSAVVLSRDTAELRRVRDAIGGLPSVAGTDSILNAQDNYQWLKEHEKQVPKVDWSQPPEVRVEDLGAIATRARALADAIDNSAKGQATLMPASQAKTYQKTTSDLRTFADRLTSNPSQDTAQRLSQWQDVLVQELQNLLSQFTPQPLDLAKVPVELRGHLVGSDGTYALYINPSKDLWNRDNLRQFVLDIEGAVKEKVPNPPIVTGIAPNIYHTTSAIRSSFYRATIYALTLIFVLVLIDLRDLAQTLLAVSVLALGLPMLVGLMGLLGVDWNFANFFGLPILIGAGHEYGVFMIHRYREALQDPRRVWRRWDVADRALLLCAYVTCSSFAFFWALGHHRGLMSLGLVMAMGTACIYLSTIMVLRPLLKWLLEKRLALPSGGFPVENEDKEQNARIQ
jgi:uncharacterized protein